MPEPAAAVACQSGFGVLHARVRAPDRSIEPLRGRVGTFSSRFRQPRPMSAFGGKADL